MAWHTAPDAVMDQNLNCLSSLQVIHCSPSATNVQAHTLTWPLLQLCLHLSPVPDTQLGDAGVY